MSLNQISTVTTTWRDKLEASTDERQVVGVVKDYLALFDPLDLWQLPEECRPPVKFFNAEDVMVYAFALAGHQSKVAAELEPLVLKLATFFSQAAYRLSQVMARTNDED